MPTLLRLTRPLIVACGLMLPACAALHEELPEGVELTPAPVEVETTGDGGLGALVETAVAPRVTGDPRGAGAGVAPPYPGPGTAGTTAVARVTGAAPSEQQGATPDFDASDEDDWTVLSGRAAAAAETAYGQEVPAVDTGLAAHVEAALVSSLETASASGAAERVASGLAMDSSFVPEGLATQARAADVTGDGQPELLAAVPVPGQPLFVLRATDAGWHAIRLPAEWPSHRPAGAPQIEGLQDFDGDGSNDLVYSMHQPRTDRSLTSVHVIRWADGLPTEVFATTLDDWAGPAASNELWTIDEGTGVLRTRCAALGAFDGRLLDHPVESRAYAWDDDAGAFVLVERDVDAPTSARQAANAAEEAFRAGDIAAAEALFLDVADGAYPLREGVAVDWSSLAQLRLGQLYAATGRLAQARIAMSNVAATDGDLGRLASAFLDAFGRADAPPALGALLAEGLAQPMAALPSPLTAEAILWPGHVLAAWVALRGMDTLGDEPHVTLGIDLGLDVADARVADLDADGDPEVLAVLPAVGGGRTLWLVDTVGDTPVAHALQSGDELRLGDVVELATGGDGILVEDDSRPGVWGWTGAWATRHEPAAPHERAGYHPAMDPRPGAEPCRVR